MGIVLKPFPERCTRSTSIQQDPLEIHIVTYFVYRWRWQTSTFCQIVVINVSLVRTSVTSFRACSKPQNKTTNLITVVWADLFFFYTSHFFSSPPFYKLIFLSSIKSHLYSWQPDSNLSVFTCSVRPAFQSPPPHSKDKPTFFYH